MSRLDEWLDAAESMPRCLTACTSELGDLTFGLTLWVARGDAGAADDEKGRWFLVDKGYVFIGPRGQSSRYQPCAPPDIDPATLPRLPVPVRGQLWNEIEATLHLARTLLVDKHAGGGGLPELVCAEDDVPRVEALVQRLEAALLTRNPVRNTDLLRRSVQSIVLSAGSGVKTAVQTACGEVLAMRELGLVEAPVWAVTMLRHEAVMRTGGAMPHALAFKLFEAGNARYDPEESLRKTVCDLATAGKGVLVGDICDSALEMAEKMRESALDAPFPRAHRDALYMATGYAFLALRIAELTLRFVTYEDRQKDLTDGLLQSYVAQTEEIVNRAAQAVGVSCVNEGSRASFEHHRAIVAASGPSKADELIEFDWFYPRGARSALLRTV